MAVFVVAEGKVLLLHHRKLQKWLPPGGHIEPGELPDEAAVREVREETGLEVELVGEKALPDSIVGPRQLVIPAGVQLEDIDGEHQHIDFVYFAKPIGNLTPIGNSESTELGWYGLDELPEGITPEIAAWCEKAINALSAADVEESFSLKQKRNFP